MTLVALRLLQSCWYRLQSWNGPNGTRLRPRLRVEELESRLAPSTLTVLAEADARVEKANARTNYGTSRELVSDLSPQRETFIRFAVGGVSEAVRSAKLRVYVTDGSVNGPAIYATGTAWSETSITWNNRPARIGGPLDDKGAVARGWQEFDVTPWVSGNGGYSFVLAGTSSDGLYMYSRQRSGFAPQLILTLADDAAVPPSGVGQNWSSPRQVGTLDPDFVDESSGMAVSRAYPNRIYHINDSGDGGYFYISDYQGQNRQRVQVNGFNPVDAEDLAYGTYGGKNYLIIGDIGDNGESRSSITLVVVEEQASFGTSVNAAFKVTLKYPDGAHNAEALALHPNGDLYILTKENPSRVYRLTAAQWQNTSGQTQTLQFVGQFGLASQTGSSNITAFDISPDGSRLLVLTYRGALELEARLNNGVLDFSQYTTSGGPAYKVIQLTRLDQQESISYLPNGRDFLYTSESLGDAVPILEVDRLD